MIKETNTELIEFLLSLIKNAPVGIISLDMNCHVNLSNNEAARHLGFDINNCLNQNILHLIRKNSRLYKQLDKCSKKGRENFVIHKSHINKRFLTISGNKVINGMLIITHDITEQVEREYEIMKKNKQLEVYNEQLQHIAFALSHNLRSPIASMLGLVNICRKEFRGGDKLKIIDMIDDSARKMDDVVKSMNEVMSIQNEEIRKEWLDLNDHFDTVLSMIKPKIKEKNITINVDFEREPKVYAKKEYIDDILINLINNAIYYRSPKRSCNINITSNRLSDQSIIRVSDNGVGLNVKTEQEKIFRIYQPPGADSGNFELGYYVVKAQVEQMKGTLNIKSREEKGTTLTISLPRH